MVLVDKARLAEDDEAKSLEDLRADIEAFLLDLGRGSILNSSQQVRRNRGDESRSVRFAAIGDDTTNGKRKNIEGLGLGGRSNVGDELVDDRGEMILTNLGRDPLNALHGVRLDLHVRVVELLDEGGADAPLKALLDLISRLRNFVAKVVRSGEPDIVIEVLAILQHLGKVGRIASMLSSGSSSV